MEKANYQIYLIILILSVSTAYADGLGNCQLGNYPLGDCITTPPSASSSEGSGGTGSIIIPPELSNPFGTEPINNSCLKKQQILDNRCYDCDPVRGYLMFNPSDRSVVCVLCSTDSLLVNRTCISSLNRSLNQTNQSQFFTKLNEYGKKVNPRNPAMGVILLALVVIGGAMWMGGKKKKEPPKEDEELFDV